jgi:biopolymer transport protein ExbD
MAFRSPQEEDLMSEINTTPLVDVMLVLLIIFMITVPVLTHAVKIDLPQASSQPNEVPPAHISLGIDAGGQLFWDEQPVSLPDYLERIRTAARQLPQPELHLRADKNARYEPVAQVMAAAQHAGMQRIGIVTEPDPP